MNSKHLAALALAIAGTLAAGAAHAGGRADVQWSVTIGSPHSGVIVGSPYYAPRPYAPRVYAPRGYVQPVVVVPRHGARRGDFQRGYRDRDRDGIPNRYDRVYNPRWDRDGDGIPNRRDPRPNRPGR